MSSEDLRKGGRWNKDLADQLQQTNFGIICLTPDNLEAPWILFEAGALSKFVDESNVTPFLVNVRPSDLPKPLTQFNAASAEKGDFRKLLKTINEAKPDEAVQEVLLDRSFDACWPKLEEKLKAAEAVAKPATKAVVAKSERGDKLDPILQELLLLARNQQQLLNSPEQLFPPRVIRELARNVERNSLPAFTHVVWKDLFTAWSDLQEAAIKTLKGEPNEAELEMARLIGELDQPLTFLLRFLPPNVRGRLNIDVSRRVRREIERSQKQAEELMQLGDDEGDPNDSAP